MTPPNRSQSAIVIGGGIIGISCAHYLVSEGIDVTIVDKGKVGTGCSLGNNGHILPSHVLPLNSPGSIRQAIGSVFDKTSAFKVSPEWSWSFANWMIRFALLCRKKPMMKTAGHLQRILDFSFAELEKLIDDQRFDCEWQHTGLTYLFRHQSSFHKFGRTNDELSDHFGVAAKKIPGPELNKFDPALNTGLAGGFFYDIDASLRPEHLVREWLALLKKNGVKFIENEEIKSVENSAGQITSVQTRDRSYDADIFVIAAGALSRQVAHLMQDSIPLIPGKGYSITIPGKENLPSTPVVLPEHNVAITPFSDALRIGSIMEFVGFDETISDHRVSQLRRAATEFLKFDVENGNVNPWFGWRPMTWDSLPIIGRLPKLKNALVATGHGMLGVMLAAGTGRLVADLALERTPPVSETPYSPLRFK